MDSEGGRVLVPGLIPEGRGFKFRAHIVPTSTPPAGVRLVPTTVEVEVELDDEAVFNT